MTIPLKRLAAESPWMGPLVGVAGALAALGFVPLGWFFLPLLSCALLFTLWLNTSPWVAARLGFWFGLGMFGVGVSWVYVAIHEIGGTAVLLALFLTLLFIAFLSLYPAIVGYLSAWLRGYLSIGYRTTLYLLLPLTWLAGELVRARLFTGFPWLSLGYSAIDSPLIGWAPLLGVFGVTLAMAFSAAALVDLALTLTQRNNTHGGVLSAIFRYFPVFSGIKWSRDSSFFLHTQNFGSNTFVFLRAISLLLLLWGGGWAAGHIEWAEPAGDPLHVTLIQGNQPQLGRWDAATTTQRLHVYRELTEQVLPQSDLVVWPENALTMFYQHVPKDYFMALENKAQAVGSDIVLGLPVLAEDGTNYYTSLLNLGVSGRAFYHKHHLVPFGEFLPLEGLLRGLIAFFDIPMSSFSSGAEQQPPLIAAGRHVAPTICFEDAFGHEVVAALGDATLLLNASNNGWYGDSLAPHQHLQIARLRVIETARPLVRVTTNGISVLTDHRGRLLARSQQFVTDVISGTIQPMQGKTPYAKWGDVPLFALLGAGLLAVVGYVWRQIQRRSRR